MFSQISATFIKRSSKQLCSQQHFDIGLYQATSLPNQSKGQKPGQPEQRLEVWPTKQRAKAWPTRAKTGSLAYKSNISNMYKYKIFLLILSGIALEQK